MNGKKLFRKLLMTWHCKKNKRAMPWKGEKDPYKVWLSEIILQQTRVEQGWNYYERFIQTYPTIQDLANAKDEAVFKLWEGLGYYTRCKNLLHTARNINENFTGIFPNDYHSILQLKGIGSYTASAIVSFCFNQPFAVVDGNVLRILARYFGIDLPVDSIKNKKIFAGLAQECLDKKFPGEYNQSIMDFGATVCKPVPLCNECPLRLKCIAFNTNKVSVLPVKEKRIIKKERWFNYFVFSFNNKIFVQQRTAKDIWQHLYQYYLSETNYNVEWNAEKVKYWLEKNLSIKKTKTVSVIPAQKQLLTHQTINGYFIYVELNALPEILNNQAGEWLSNSAVRSKAFPQFLHQFLYRKAMQLQVL
jgi:A/G-specific adenine glycosylase